MFYGISDPSIYVFFTLPSTHHHLSWRSYSPPPAKDSILGDVLHPGWETIKLREAQWNRVPQTPTSPEALEPPMFTKHLESQERLQVISLATVL